MEPRIILSVFIVISITFTFPSLVSSKLFLFEDAYHLHSSDFNYPHNNETIDVLWLFSHSVRLKFHGFHLNGHMGDFFLVSEYPLLNIDEFKGMNGTEDEEEYVDKLAKSVVTDHGLLLSWIVKDKTIEVVNNKGTFLLFHSEPKDPTGTAQFKGFEIEVVNYDDLITTTTSTTPDPVISPKPGQDVYMSKFLSCKDPIEFYNNTNHFKSLIARLATEYCLESGIQLTGGDIRQDEVNMPGSEAGANAGLHYCDPSWAVYATCVEVTFSIRRVDSEGNFVLPKPILEDMWEKKSYNLSLNGYCPFKPPGAVADLNTLIWVAFFGGITLSLLLLLGLAWIKSTRMLLEYKMSVSATADPGTDIVDGEDKPHTKHFDERNPMYRFIPSNAKPHREELYPTRDYLDQEEKPAIDNQKKYDSMPTASVVPSVVIQTVPADVYAFDNSAFENDQDGNSTKEPAKDPLLKRGRDDNGGLESVSLAPAQEDASNL